MIKQSIRTYLLFLVCSGFVLSCSERGSVEHQAYNLPEEATAELKEQFRLSEPAEGSFFIMIKQIHLLGDGNLVVQNYPDHQLYELSADGGLISVIGREGRGPGEFIETFNSHLTRGDSLHVYDPNNLRHQVLKKNKKEGAWEYVRERVFKREIPKELREQIPEDLVYGPEGTKGVFRIHPRDTLDAQYQYVAEVDHDIEHKGKVSRLMPVEDLALYRRNENSLLTHNNERFFMAFYLYDPYRDEVLYIKNTSNEIITIDSAGNKHIKGHLPFEQFPLDREELRHSLKNVNYFYSGMEEIVREKLLPHEPYYWNIVLNNDHLWVNLARSDTSKPNWVITTLDGEVLESFHGPRSISNVTIRDNRMYGSVEDSNDVTYLVGFELLNTQDRSNH